MSDQYGAAPLRPFRFLALAALPFMLSACDFPVLFPDGDVAARQRDMLLIATGLMLLIIVPVIFMSLYFPWRYRATNKATDYDADWDHSTKLELAIWTGPLLIIIVLGAVTWVGTHLLDPFRPLDRITTSNSVALHEEPLEVQVVAMNWKWLFIYPQYGVATVNELAAPVDRPIRFDLTAESVMNAFYVPTMAGMIYSMPGMETKLHAVMNTPGVFDGFASHYNGAGFSDMHFKFYSQKAADFDAWIQNLKASDKALDTNAYLDLAKPSEAVPVEYFSSVEPDLYKRVLGMCVEPGKLCMQQIVNIDAGKAEAGKDVSIDQLKYDSYDLDAYGSGEAQGATAPAANRLPHSDQTKSGNSESGEDTIAPPQLHND
ncbi:ubiquinol oxidase subunit II [Jiella sonneratiae]|uniref:Ubiquinol oxidase polypeptide II n=1 Tax=Jiella sonneratiae TaxID=2816856 RepID=A0ABS3JBB2_9HYPH|nr:ubiquinol oxidase subunit II [Jiella sonneratiae]MBO0906430.1 ubiquinol oxidase subunit II [Jiella sonneratiae]